MVINGLTGFDWHGGSPSKPWLRPGAYSFPRQDLSLKDSLGLLYSQSAITDSRGICPTGWYVPTDNETKEMEMCIGMSQADADPTGTFRGDIAAKMVAGGTSGLEIKQAGYVFLDPAASGAQFFNFMAQEHILQLPH